MPYCIEHTDTYCGEPNYAWVHRYIVDAKDMPQAILAARAAVGWRGLRTITGADSGGMASLRLPRVCQIVFIDWQEAEYAQGKPIDIHGNPLE